jgi:hypothetical protein
VSENTAATQAFRQAERLVKDWCVHFTDRQVANLFILIREEQTEREKALFDKAPQAVIQ